MSQERDKYAIIVAGGSGVRMGASIPKQMVELDGHPILRYTIEQFRSLPFNVRIILVLGKDSKELWREYCRKEQLFFQYTLVDGGITRFHSVMNGLKYVKTAGVVAVHDGVRPFVSKEDLINIYNTAVEKGSAIPTIQVVDSMRMVDGCGGYKYEDRSRYILVQTPQAFRSEVLLDSYSQPFSVEFTDDASVVEKKGYPLTFCEGSRLNIKITTPEDLELAKSIIHLKHYNL